MCSLINDHPAVLELKETVHDEIKDATVLLPSQQSTSWLRGIFENQSVTTVRASEYLDTSRLYSTKRKRWFLPTKESTRVSERPLHQQLATIVNDIFKRFGLFQNRKAVVTAPTCSTSTKNEKHKHDADLFPAALPELMIFGEDEEVFPVVCVEYPSARPCNRITEDQRAEEAEAYYMQGIAPFHVQRKESEEKLEERLNTLGMYAGSFMMSSGTRRFVYGVLMTEEDVQLVQFDRSGVTVSQKVNIHTEAAAFVQIIASLGCKDVSSLGFDSSRFWKNEKQLIRSLDRDRNPCEYEVVEETYFQANVCGKSTFCCKAKPVDGDDSDMVLIKECWREAAFDDETEFASEALGAKGVAQIVTVEYHKSEELSTLMLRSSRRDVQQILGSTSQFSNRYFVRIVAELYGKPLEAFENDEQLLGAFRDVVEGHRNLYQRGILHRDISHNNVLLGKEDAPVGDRGVLIDFDAAARVVPGAELTYWESPVGTITLRSVKCIDSAVYDRTWYMRHDYLDDLESLLYLLASIFIEYEGGGRRSRKRLESWRKESQQNVARASKYAFMSGRGCFPLSKHYSREPLFRTLLCGLRDCLWRYTKSKFPSETRTRPPDIDYDDLAEGVYEEYIALIDQAISDLTKSTKKNELGSKSAPPSPQSKKRRDRQEDDVASGVEKGASEDESNGKRLRKT